MANLSELRKDAAYLSSSPSMFSGTVKENIDPDGQFQEDEIVRTLHFLKVFEALQFYTGYRGTKEM